MTPEISNPTTCDPLRKKQAISETNMGVIRRNSFQCYFYLSLPTLCIKKCDQKLKQSVLSSLLTFIVLWRKSLRKLFSSKPAALLHLKTPAIKTLCFLTSTELNERITNLPQTSEFVCSNIVGLGRHSKSSICFSCCSLLYGLKRRQLLAPL